MFVGNAQVKSIADEVKNIDERFPLDNDHHPLDDVLDVVARETTQGIRRWFEGTIQQERSEEDWRNKQDFEKWGVLYASLGLYEHSSLFFDLHRLRREGKNEEVRAILRQFHIQRFYIARLFEDEVFALHVNPLQYFGPGHVRVQRTEEREGMRPTPGRRW